MNKEIKEALLWGSRLLFWLCALGILISSMTMDKTSVIEISRYEASMLSIGCVLMLATAAISALKEDRIRDELETLKNQKKQGKHSHSK